MTWITTSSCITVFWHQPNELICDYRHEIIMMISYGMEFGSRRNVLLTCWTKCRHFRILQPGNRCQAITISHKCLQTDRFRLKSNECYRSKNFINCLIYIEYVSIQMQGFRSFWHTHKNHLSRNHVFLFQKDGINERQHSKLKRNWFRVSSEPVETGVCLWCLCWSRVSPTIPVQKIPRKMSPKAIYYK